MYIILHHNIALLSLLCYAIVYHKLGGLHSRRRELRERPVQRHRVDVVRVLAGSYHVYYYYTYVLIVLQAVNRIVN